MLSRRATYALVAPGALVLLALFVLPLVQLASVSLQSPYPGRPGYYYRDVNVGGYLRALTTFAPQLGRSVLYAALATVLCLALSLPLAWTLAHRAGRWRRPLMVLVMAPYLTSFVLRTMAWRQVLADEAPIARGLRAAHLLPGGHLTETGVAVVMGLACTFLPFMLVPIQASLQRVDPSLLQAGGDLYATPWQTFRLVTLPLAMPGVVAGVLLTFIPAAGDYVNADLLGADRGTSMVGNAIDAQFFRVIGGYPTAAALSFTLMLVILGLVGAYLRRYGREELL